LFVLYVLALEIPLSRGDGWDSKNKCNDTDVLLKTAFGGLVSKNQQYLMVDTIMYDICDSKINRTRKLIQHHLTVM
jgi:hypothetical protein